MISVKKILLEIKEVDNYHLLGIQLGIKCGDLKRIERDYMCDTERCKAEIVDFWLRNTQECTWSTLAQAIAEMGGHNNLVQTLRNYHQGQ